MKNYEDILINYDFLRVHKSHLVNREHVVNYTADGMLTMSDLAKVEVSRRRKADVIEALKNK